MKQEFLSAALTGFEQKKAEIEKSIKEIRAMLTGKQPRSTSTRSSVGGNGSRNGGISPEGRRRIAAAQRKRWANAKRASAAHSVKRRGRRTLHPVAA